MKSIPYYKRIIEAGGLPRRVTAGRCRGRECDARASNLVHLSSFLKIFTYIFLCTHFVVALVAPALVPMDDRSAGLAIFVFATARFSFLPSF